MILASNNKGKINELKNIFQNEEILSLKDVNIDIDIIEDGKTFYDNALIKAKAIYKIAKQPVIADDSGLIFTELGDWPGVNTKRISNNQDNDESDRNQILINKGKELKNKEIKAVCTLVYYDGTNIISATGELLGTIAEKETPGNGFGFDRCFILKDGRVMSSISSEEKNEISHRALASKKLKEELKKRNIIND